MQIVCTVQQLVVAFKRDRQDVGVGHVHVVHHIFISACLNDVPPCYRVVRRAVHVIGLQISADLCKRFAVNNHLPSVIFVVTKVCIGTRHDDFHTNSPDICGRYTYAAVADQDVPELAACREVHPLKLHAHEVRCCRFNLCSSGL